MALDRQAFERSHIPGSPHPDNMVAVPTALSSEDEIIVYCANPACSASFRAYMMLQELGCRNLYRYPGELEEWRSVGYELAGNMVS